MPKSSWNTLPFRGGVSALALVALTLVGGCAANSEMTDTWRDPSLAPGTVRNVLVVGVRKDPVRRRMWEDAFTKALTARGVTATASYVLYPDAPPDTQQVIETVRKRGCDAVLISMRLQDDSSSQYVPGSMRPEQVTSWDRFGRFHSYWVTVQQPGYTETSTIIQLQTDLWTTSGASGQLAWSGTLRTLDAINNDSVDRAVNHNIMPEMEKEGVVPSTPK
jgi:hypothetical protein